MTGTLAIPALHGDRATDARVLTEFIGGAEEVLADLPPRAGREPRQQELADRVHADCRALREGFVRRHAAALYRELTGDLTGRLRLPEVAFGAAKLVPGLVPTAEQIAAELRHEQAGKEGREIDQGILFGALLAVPREGEHLVESMLAPAPRSLGLAESFARAGQAELGTVRLSRSDGVTTLEVHNDRCLNAEDNRLAEDMETAVDLVLLDPATRVGVLRGAPMSHPRYAGRRVFSAGINLRDLHRGRISYVDFLLARELGYLNKIVRGLFTGDGSPTVQKPWVAVVESFAIGGGAQLAMVFDRVIAAADAYFSLPAAQEGIVPGASNLRLIRRAGSRIARQMILGGRKVWAHEPDARLLCDEVADPREIEAVTARAAEQLSAPAVVANRRMLGLAEEPPERFREYLAAFAGEQARRLYSDDVLGKVRRAALHGMHG
ncbi:enoyl-CoA hydratase/isomerase family protein [Micromonospora sp. KC207]|uniref:(3,5-dihydroxyphenyl)acetyl-CoA 1,2-dioxygenase DpgC n=1 Tax=Micromonospora sp. KC207 TaxID=2530377 RepID=UPI0010476EF0|nr:(3,5-dihydroxyphenyl)acetyl-CoA 1,2-dioxygenase DpgC [Micromonospora sp. KC207]TDC49303.1 enoyl-CoA hydratase/isomerase family protein [Micromonospora sp. KC207]